jgi:hypothetical protein
MVEQQFSIYLPDMAMYLWSSLMPVLNLSVWIKVDYILMNMFTSFVFHPGGRCDRCHILGWYDICSMTICIPDAIMDTLSCPIRYWCCIFRNAVDSVVILIQMLLLKHQQGRICKTNISAYMFVYSALMSCLLSQVIFPQVITNCLVAKCRTITVQCTSQIKHYIWISLNCCLFNRISTRYIT